MIEHRFCITLLSLLVVVTDTWLIEMWLLAFVIKSSYSTFSRAYRPHFFNLSKRSDLSAFMGTIAVPKASHLFSSRPHCTLICFSMSLCGGGRAAFLQSLMSG